MSNSTSNHILFKGGVHPNDGKVLSSSVAIKEAPLCETYTVILQQHIGAPPVAQVKKGDEVKKGQVLAEAGGFVSAPVHSPTSGTVTEIGEISGSMGVKLKAVIIKADGKDEACYPFEGIKNWQSQSADDLKKRIGAAGIVGLGGAAFPTFVKLSPPDDQKIDNLILNGAECEPYLTADLWLMLEYAEGILEGAAILAQVLKIKNITIGIENNKPDAIKKLSSLADKYGVKIQGLRVRYPQGAEKQLIYAITGRKVPAGGLPMNVGCVVQNVGTAFAIKEAVVDGKPLFERITTITGTPVKHPGNWRLRIGTPLIKALELAGGVTTQPGKLIMGGPMMGFAQKTLDAPIMKNTSGILLLATDEVTQYSSDPCIRCGRCVDACPMNLLPSTISSAAENEAFDLAEDYNVMDCIECGCCSYVCPAHRPLVQHFKRSKAEIIAKRRNK